jgi:hypothetical protein
MNAHSLLALLALQGTLIGLAFPAAEAPAGAAGSSNSSLAAARPDLCAGSNTLAPRHALVRPVEAFAQHQWPRAKYNSGSRAGVALSLPFYRGGTPASCRDEH